MAVPFVINPVLPAFRARHPRVEVEVDVEDRFVDIVAEGYDAGVRLSESIERDMVQVRLTDAFRFVVVGAPSYLERHGTPEKPQDLLRHECITFRARTTGALYAWELERGRKTWRVPVRAGVVTGDSEVMLSLAESGAGLAYVFEPSVQEPLRTGRLKIVLEAYAPIVPGFFLYFPSHAQRSPPLRLFIEAAKELAVRAL
jgi:DNA-binding transcriptional LysR family regulator